MNAEACSYTVRLMRHRCSTYPDKFHQPGTSCSLAASPRRTMGTGKSFCPFCCPRCSVPEGMFVGDGVLHYLVLTQPAKVRGRLSADIGRLLLRVVSTKDFEFCFLSNKHYPSLQNKYQEKLCNLYMFVMVLEASFFLLLLSAS